MDCATRSIRVPTEGADSASKKSSKNCSARLEKIAFLADAQASWSKGIWALAK
jgi:hypothetical protein